MPKYAGINRHYSSDKTDGPSQTEKQAERDRLMQEFLNKGGKVEKVKSKITKQMLDNWKF